jgi:acyl-coenzyme A thioesterase PaaI-like protein
LVSVRTIIGRKLDPDEAFAEVTAGEFVPPSAAQQLRAIPGLANSSGFVHGGVIAIAGIHAAERELGSLGTAGIRIFYARPISADGSELRIDPTVVHRGRRAGLARVEVRPAGGDQVAAWMMVAGVGKENASNQGGSDG